MRKRFPKKAASGLLLAAWLFTSGGCSAPPEVTVHYLGHSSFLLEFGDGTTVLTDYGVSNAYGLDSPIADLGGLVPDIVTISHEHEDHFRGTLPDGVRITLRGAEMVRSGDLTITPIPTFERALTSPDNFSFLFEYRGLKILHLGDCQSMMLAFTKGMLGPLGRFYDREELVRLIRKTYPDAYDLVLLPIGFTEDILPEAAAFATYLDTRAIIPMHYWTPGDRDAFLGRMADLADPSGRNYQARPLEGSDFVLRPAAEPTGVVEVLGLVPGEPVRD